MSERPTQVPVNFRLAVPRESGNYVEDAGRTRQFLAVANAALKAAGYSIELVEVFETEEVSRED
ncbi:hypothetical protein QM806_04600 [Rhodococcus sp. IEGM 1351]|uniref:hypothetical protein n=1 Tax=Rhodococcus sp. IEGM 1351 TaxID=3047089 RepID=UPI0024B81B5E|nr:hypothetical protein [Rhodococcus sp. IEGM 1351]MDI9934735.1 hypothetical protein [Rhodococcus sp. IEGM 1351]